MTFMRKNIEKESFYIAHANRLELHMLKCKSISIYLPFMNRQIQTFCSVSILNIYLYSQFLRVYSDHRSVIGLSLIQKNLACQNCSNQNAIEFEPNIVQIKQKNPIFNTCVSIYRHKRQLAETHFGQRYRGGYKVRWPEFRPRSRCNSREYLLIDLGG